MTIIKFREPGVDSQRTRVFRESENINNPIDYLFSVKSEEIRRVIPTTWHTKVPMFTRVYKMVRGDAVELLDGSFEDYSLSTKDIIDYIKDIPRDRTTEVSLKYEVVGSVITVSNWREVVVSRARSEELKSFVTFLENTVIETFAITEWITELLIVIAAKTGKELEELTTMLENVYNSNLMQKADVDSPVDLKSLGVIESISNLATGLFSFDIYEHKTRLMFGLRRLKVDHNLVYRLDDLIDELFAEFLFPEE